MTSPEKISLYFRSFFIKVEDSNEMLKSFNMDFSENRFVISDDFKLHSGIFLSDKLPVTNAKKIAFDTDTNGNQFNYQYPIYILEKKGLNQDYLFCCFPNIELTPDIFPRMNYHFIQFKLLKICSEFYKRHNSASLRLTRLNGKLSYDGDDSVNSIALYGNNNLQSNVIKEFLQLYPKGRRGKIENPFEEAVPMIVPNSCSLTCSKNNMNFSLNVDSVGNSSFYLDNLNQFKHINEILTFVIKSESYGRAEKSPLKRSITALLKVENNG